MPPKSIILWKHIGQTPLECLNQARNNHPKWADLPMTYAGRLDPMAEGLLIVLLGEECKNKDQYLGLDKTYEFQILVGFSTDTYDLLGMVDLRRKEAFLNGLVEPTSPLGESAEATRGTEEMILSSLNLMPFIGTFIQKYPAFSSKTVDGKQLFQLSKEDELPDQLPEHEVTIYKLSCTSTMIQRKDELEKEILRRITLVNGDFRQEEIKKRWEEAFQESDQKEFTIFNCVAECSSGTYIRQLVADIGKKLKVPLVTYSIKRTKIGEYTLHDILDR